MVRTIGETYSVFIGSKSYVTNATKHISMFSVKIAKPKRIWMFQLSLFRIRSAFVYSNL